MPQTNKAKYAAVSNSAQAAGQDRGEPDSPEQQSSQQDSGQDGNQGDADIIKSPSDPKQYRYIELSNGLRALLISDFSNDGKPEDEEDEDDDEEEEEEEEGEEEEEDSGEGTEEEEEEEEEEQDSDFEELNDDMEEKKKKGSEKQSAAALCIGVGSFSDPDDLPGFAHFLEHMVFMGSEKYPSENGFDAFLKKHGGSDNASTDCERTVFQFDVQRKRFREALDRWAQFFICPLMIKDAIEREVEAVDSEYQLAKPSDSHRKEMLFGSLAKPDHPMSKFCWGNAETLKTEPKKKKINVYKRLREFWKKHYSAHYMTLAVQSKEKLDTLEQWVREIFSEVPNNGLPKPDFSDRLDPFDTPAFNKLYRVVPVRKVHALTITWALPPQEKHYRVKPLHYIAWLIGHEGAGSILSLLRRKCWAVALFGGNSETGFDQNATYSIFSISITLTDEGFQNFYQVAHLVFQYLKMLQTLGPHACGVCLFAKCVFVLQTDPIEYVEDVCENMQLFPKEDFLTGDQLLFEYKPEVISAALNLLTPDKVNLLLLSPEHEGQCPLKEKWFGTQYSVEDIQKDWQERWTGEFELNPKLQLPDENQFISTEFTLKTSDCPDTDYPVRIASNDRGCLWYKKDNKFKIPKAYIRFHLISPVVQKSPKNLVLFDLFVNILVHAVAEPAYEADVAQLEYKLLAGEHGLIIKVKGFNHKLPKILNFVAEFQGCQRFQPCLDVRLLILEHSRWSMIQKYQAVVEGLTVDELMEFVNSFKRELYAEGLVQGNFTSVESAEFLKYITEKLQFQKLPVEVPVLFRVVELPQKHHLCKVKSLNKGDANSEVTVYYQVTALVKLKGCEDTHLGEEVDRNWTEVLTQQYVFNRLNREIDALKLMTKAELVNWFMEHRGETSRKLSIHVVGFGVEENDPPAAEGEEGGASNVSLYGEVSKLTFLPPSDTLSTATPITDIIAFTSSLSLYPYHKILK
uniref:Nardilysin a (N-arginine dibasic convertase) n=1 Tax=Astyanax mexicanus TaxID=7994 RepID=A0A8B9L7U6_ASTMX